MLLGQVSYLDCLVFVVLLIPQLLLHVNTFDLMLCGLKALPFLCLQLPYEFIAERLRPKRQQSPFVQQASLFQDFVIRCVRYAFAKIPASIGRVFFSKNVALPFLRFRMLRHGYLRHPLPWTEIDEDGLKGLLIRHDPSSKPDVIVYYCHGGGFAMGSSHFYLEPMLVLASLLKTFYQNPAVFALEYSLIPDAHHPTQVLETAKGYEYVLSMTGGDASRICLAGDSAGGCLVLSLLRNMDKELKKPAYATLLSPWVTLVSTRDRNTASDFLDVDTLHKYGAQYAHSKNSLRGICASPGSCTHPVLLREAAPTNGFYMTFGTEEVFCPEIRAFIKALRKAGVGVRVREEPGAIHAWVIASLFLGDGFQERFTGMRDLVKAIVANIEPQ